MDGTFWRMLGRVVESLYNQENVYRKLIFSFKRFFLEDLF
ncbi:hypothetical protein CPK_ORF00545 [Chlamydia pneumoniae LPCoLN]|nr:hypothetical protein CPK_ORF00545 [Chlamydia pneumoniae LPCoLN]